MDEPDILRELFKAEKERKLNALSIELVSTKHLLFNLLKGLGVIILGLMITIGLGVNSFVLIGLGSVCIVIIGFLIYYNHKKNILLQDLENLDKYSFEEFRKEVMKEFEKQLQEVDIMEEFAEDIKEIKKKEMEEMKK